MPEQFSNDLLLLEKLAQGGMAEVFRAKQIGVGGFQKNVAVKRILPECAKIDEFKQMFLRETSLCALLQHPNIIQVFSTGERDGYLYLVMEFLDGKTLQDIFDMLTAAGVQAPIDVTSFLIAEAAKGLGYAHNAKDPKTGEGLNVVHRDISPHNIMVSYDGSVKVVDFGIAKAKSSADLTQAGVIKGKEGYLSPEMVKGADPDRRADIFALGVVLYEMLTGKFLFDGETTLETLKAIDACEIPEISYKGDNLNPELDQILRKALARNPDERYQTCDQFAKDLTVFLNKNYPGFTSTDLGDFMYALFKEQIEQERKVRESEDIKIPENAWEEMGATAVFQIPDELKNISSGTGNIIIQQNVIQEKEEDREPETFKSRLLRSLSWTAISLVISLGLFYVVSIVFESLFSSSPSEFWSSLIDAKGRFDPLVFKLKGVVAPCVAFAVVVLLFISVPGLILGGVLGSRYKMFDVFLSLTSYISFMFIAVFGFNSIAFLQKIESTALWFSVVLRASVEQITQIVHLSPAITSVGSSVDGKQISTFIADRLKTKDVIKRANEQLSAIDDDLIVVRSATKVAEQAKEEVIQVIDSPLVTEITSKIFGYSLATETFLGLFVFGYLIVLSNTLSKHFLFSSKREKLFRFYFVAVQAAAFFIACNITNLAGVSSQINSFVLGLGFVSVPSEVLFPLVVIWFVLFMSVFLVQLFVGTEKD